MKCLEVTGQVHREKEPGPVKGWAEPAKVEEAEEERVREETACARAAGKRHRIRRVLHAIA